MKIFGQTQPDRFYDMSVNRADCVTDALKTVADWQKGNLLHKGVAHVIAAIKVPSALALASGSHFMQAAFKGSYAFLTRGTEITAAACGKKINANVLNLKHASGREAAVHLRKAVVNLLLNIPIILKWAVVPVGVGMMIFVPSMFIIPSVAMGLVAPTAVQKRVLEFVGAAKAANEPGRVKKAAQKCLNGIKAAGRAVKPSKRTLKIAGGVAVGAAAVTAGICALNAYGYLAADSRLAGVTFGAMDPRSWSIFAPEAAPKFGPVEAPYFNYAKLNPMNWFGTEVEYNEELETPCLPNEAPKVIS